MIYKKKHSEVQGLWCRKNKTFYYYESGNHSIRNPLDRIKNTLVSRGLLTWDLGGTKLHEEPVVMMSWAAAEERGYQVEPIYFSDHIKAQVLASQGGIKPSQNPWS